MIRELVDMYESGAITEHHLAVECLNMLDPRNPDRVLADLPENILDAILEFSDRYVSDRMETNHGAIPTRDQVSTARRWIHDKHPSLTSSD